MEIAPTPAAKPWLFLDVDGVVVPDGYVFRAEALDEKGKNPHPECLSFDFYHTVNKVNARVFVPRQIQAMVVELATVYDIVWASTWAAHARELDAVLGIEAVHCLVPQMGWGSRGAMKGEAVAGFLMGDDPERTDDEPRVARLRPFAWADDKVHTYMYDTHEGPLQRLAQIAIPCDERVGLTRAHAEALKAFAANL